MFWCLVRLSTGALSGGLYVNPFEMAIKSAVACYEAKDGGLLVSWQLMERVLVWVVSSGLAVEDGFLFICWVRLPTETTRVDTALADSPPRSPSSRPPSSVSPCTPFQFLRSPKRHAETLIPPINQSISQSIYKPTYQWTDNPLTSLTHSPTRSPTHPPTHSLTHSLPHSLTH